MSESWIKSIHDQKALTVFSMRDLCLVRGKGAKVWDDQGKEYIDCNTGNGVALLGHCPEEVMLAIQKQAETLIACAGTFYHEPRSAFLKELFEMTPLSLQKAFLCNSGTETIEAAIKFARYSTSKPEIITAMRGFHGRTYGALSATFNPKYKKGFEPLVPGFHHVPYNQIEKLKAKVNEKTAAILIEIIQGEGGVNPGKADYFKAVQDFCQEKGILLIIDEVQTGFGRTGAYFACQHFGIEPDILCLAKGIASGVPMGAVVCSERVQMDIGMHGSTFGGNPLSCAAGAATLRVMKQPHFLNQVQEKGNYFFERLNQISSEKIREIRGMGLMIGVELKEKSAPYLQKLLDRGVIALPAGATVVRFLPPLVISKEEIDVVVKQFEEALKENP